MHARAYSDAELPPEATGVKHVGDRDSESSDGASSPGEERAHGAGDELRTVLRGYARVLEDVDDSPIIVWQSGFPAPRVLVRTLVLRHVVRCVDALKRAACRRVAIDDDEAAAARDLNAIEHFDRSLPTGPRPAFITSVALFGILLIAYLLGKFLIKTPISKLLADLASAAVSLNRGAAVAAFTTDKLPAGFYVGAAIAIAWSVTFAILPLLPAFGVKRRLLDGLSGDEERAFAALGARRVHDLELGLSAHLMLVLPVAAVGITSAFSDIDLKRNYYARNVPVGVALSCLAVLAVVQLHCRYARRRGTSTGRRCGFITRASLWLASVVSILILLATFYSYR